METKEYKITVTVKNNLLYSAIIATGCQTIRDFTIRYNLPYKSVLHLVSMRDTTVIRKTKALTDNNIWKPIVKKLCAVLNTTPDTLFTARQVNYTGTRSKTVDVSEKEVTAFLAMQQQCLTGNDPLLQIEDNSEKAEINAAMEQILNTLLPNERKTIIYRFGLFDEKEHTLEECAVKLGVSRERIRQMESKALRKIKHPSRLAHFKNVDTSPYKDKQYFLKYELGNKS
jgi:RNA polymerase sigma factor (sigma-70 family)